MPKAAQDNDTHSNLKKMRQQLAWLLSQAEEYASGRPEKDIENGIFAAHKCVETAAKYRQRADNLVAIIAATEQPYV
jgi:hypothetical protein